MEKYAHLLIAADPEFAAKPGQIVGFLELVKDVFRFRFVKSKEDWLPGLQAMTSAEDVRTMRNPYTGEKQTYTVPKWFELEDTGELPALVESEPKYGVTMSGKWTPSDVPIQMLGADGRTINEELACFVSCSQRAQPVCTGDWWGEAHCGDCEFDFDNPESTVQSVGVYTHPWSGERVEVPGAGNSRFWIELEFGKFIIPKMDGGFDLLRHEFVDAAEKCFGVRFIQAGRGVA
jgi:hypothetical protein